MREPVIMSPFASMAAELLDPEQRNLEFITSRASPKAPVKEPTSSPARKKAAKSLSGAARAKIAAAQKARWAAAKKGGNR